MTIQRVVHLGLCVSDLERSRRFYRDALGFREVSRLDTADAPMRTLLQLPDAELSALFLERDGLRLELLHFARTAAPTGPRPRPMNAPGFTHLAIRVDDLEASLAALRRAGATLLEDTRMENPDYQARAAIALDPDGNRLELIEAPGDPSAPVGEPL